MKSDVTFGHRAIPKGPRGGEAQNAETTVQVLADIHVVLHVAWRPCRDQKPVSEWATERCKGGDGDF